jgi:hypothetical protein
MKKANIDLPSLLYHYCSNEAFCAIVSNSSIHLSSMSLSNDSMEGKRVERLVRALGEHKAAAQLVCDKLDCWGDRIDGLAFCLSTEEDLLSQWRGYADDARGVSIGFSSAYLFRLSEEESRGSKIKFSVRNVEYDADKQKEHLKPLLGTLEMASADLKAASADPCTDVREFEAKENKALNDVLINMYLFKGAAFKEEREWRMLGYIDLEDPSACDFRSDRTQIIPFKEFKLKPLGLPRIEHIVLGPKNTTPIKVVQGFMKKHGFQNVVVRRAQASYR